MFIKHFTDLPNVVRLCVASTLLLMCMVLPAVALVTGEAGLIYSEYTSEQDGKKDLDVSAFSQLYSLYYSTKGFVGDRRFGRYSLGLGLQWASNDTTLNDEVARSDEAKILYNGDILIAPGGLPFRLHAFSQDTQAPYFSTFSPGVILDDVSVFLGLNNPQHTVTGMTLTAGVRNGGFLGQYNDIINHLPRIFIDYRETFTRNLDGLFKQKVRTRELAFVSLNRKDNWFHIRSHDYKDFFDETEDESQQSVLLGTIDHSLKRAWIDLTNWIKISVDGSFTTTESVSYETETLNTDVYRLNLFSKAAYNRFRLSNYSNFVRRIQSDVIDSEIDLPVYASGWIDPNRSWSMQLQNFVNQEGDVSGSSSDNDWSLDESNQYMTGHLTIGHQSDVRFVSNLELESYRRNTSSTSVRSDRDGIAGRVRVELMNNHIDSQRQSFLFGYTATYIDRDIKEVFEDVPDTSIKGGLFEQELYGSLRRELNPSNTFEIKQVLRHGNGQSDINASRYILLKGFDSSSYQKSGAFTENTFGSETWISLDTRFGPALSNRISLANFVYTGVASDNNKIILKDHLRYQTNKLSILMENALYFDEELNVPNSTRNSYIPRSNAKSPDVNFLFSNNVRLDFSPNRSFKSICRFNIDYYNTDDGNAYSVESLLRNQYSLTAKAGRRAEIARFYQEIEYEKISNNLGSASYLKVMLGSSYYPRYFVRLGGELSYEVYEPTGTNFVALTTVAQLKFSKFEYEMRYSYGLGNGGKGMYDERKEHLFETSVKKFF